MKGVPASRLGGADQPPGVGTFLRGLCLGALVGAAIAGSALLERRRRAEAKLSSGSTEPSSPTDVRDSAPA